MTWYLVKHRDNFILPFPSTSKRLKLAAYYISTRYWIYS